MSRFLSTISSSPIAFLTKERRTETMTAASSVSLKMMKKIGTEKTSTMFNGVD